MTSWLAKIVFFRLMGWKIEGDFPLLKKFIIAVYPHTRKMDFVIGVLTRSVLNEKVSYVGKQELFNPLTGWFFRALGGTPVNRNSNENKVSAIAKIFKEKDAFRMAIAPEGTRKKVDHWKSGFYYIALEACKIAKEFSTPVIILTDQSLSSRIEAFSEPDISEIQEPELNLETKPAEFRPYPLESQTMHAPPGTKMAEGKYPVVTGLEHDEWGHPSSNPELHQKMTNRRRDKLKRLASSLSQPEIYGENSGDVLLIGWGSTWGPIREAVHASKENGQKVSSIHLRHIHPMPNGIEEIIDNFEKALVVEMNDEGLYGYGQLATLLRARYSNPKILSLTKTNGLGFKVSEILEGIKNAQL